MLLTMVADVTPAEKRYVCISNKASNILLNYIGWLTGLISPFRSITFFYLLTCQLVDECLVPPLTAVLMARSLWVPLIAGVAVLLLATMITATLPETLPLQQSAAKDLELDNDSMFEVDSKHDTWIDSLVRFKKSFAFATRNFTVVALLSGLVVSEVGRQSIELLLQYVSKRYAWSLSKVSLQEHCLSNL